MNHPRLIKIDVGKIKTKNKMFILEFRKYNDFKTTADSS